MLLTTLLAGGAAAAALEELEDGHAASVRLLAAPISMASALTKTTTTMTTTETLQAPLVELLAAVRGCSRLAVVARPQAALG